jgi:hypothetical protein
MQNMSLYSGGGQGGNGGGPGGNSAAQQQAVYAAHHGNHLVRIGPKKVLVKLLIGTNKHDHLHLLTMLLNGLKTRSINDEIPCKQPTVTLA